jgi:hypothetical protein
MMGFKSSHPLCREAPASSPGLVSKQPGNSWLETKISHAVSVYTRESTKSEFGFCSFFPLESWFASTQLSHPAL